MLVCADLAILIFYFLATVAIAWISAKKTSGHAEELLLAGRSLRWLPVGLSLFASNISSSTLVGLSGEAYRHGIAVASYELMAAVVLIFIAIFVLPVYFKMQLRTAPQYLRYRFGRSLEVYFSVLNLIALIVIDTAGTLYAGALIVQYFAPSLSLSDICLFFALFTGVYTAFGGLRAVVYTDSFQAWLLLFASLYITLRMLSFFDWSIANANIGLTRYDLSLLRPMEDKSLPWFGALFGVPILGFYFWGTNQLIVQRMLAAKNLEHARWACVFCALLKLTPLFIMVLPALWARHFLPDIEQGDRIYSLMLIEFIPQGWRGLALAGLFAALMSSVSSALNSTTTLLAVDFLKHYAKNIWLQRGLTLFLAIFAGFWAPIIQYFSGIYHYFQEILSYLAPPVAALFAAGIFLAGVQQKAAWKILLIGHGMAFITAILRFLGFLPYHYTIVAAWLFLFCFCLFFYVHWQSRHQFPVVWSKIMFYPEDTFPVDYRVAALGLLFLEMIIYILFW